MTRRRWRSAGAYDAFRAEFQREYEALDRACENFTRHEASLGAYWELVGPAADGRIAVALAVAVEEHVVARRLREAPVEPAVVAEDTVAVVRPVAAVRADVDEAIDGRRPRTRRKGLEPRPDPEAAQPPPAEPPEQDGRRGGVRNGQEQPDADVARALLVRRHQAAEDALPAVGGVGRDVGAR